MNDDENGPPDDWLLRLLLIVIGVSAVVLVSWLATTAYMEVTAPEYECKAVSVSETGVVQEECVEVAE